MKKEIIRKDGIVYSRQPKEKNFSQMVAFRYDEEKFKKLKEIASEKGTRYASIIRELLDEYISKEG